MTAAPGWFPDPGNPQLLRYWDGQQWTDRTVPAPGGYGAPPPVAAGAVEDPGNTFSVLGIVFGSIAFLLCPVLFGPLGMVMASKGTKKGESLSSVAMIVSIAGLVGGLLIGLLVYLSLN
jgi:hypothetical protein